MCSCFGDNSRLLFAKLEVTQGSIATLANSKSRDSNMNILQCNRLKIYNFSNQFNIYIFSGRNKSTKTFEPFNLEEPTFGKAVTETTVPRNFASKENTLGVIKHAVSLLANFKDTTVATATTARSVSNVVRSTFYKTSPKKKGVSDQKISKPIPEINKSNGIGTALPVLLDNFSLLENSDTTKYLFTIVLSIPASINESLKGTNASNSTNISGNL